MLHKHLQLSGTVTQFFFIECYTEGIFDLLMLQVSSSAKFKIKFSRCFKNMLTKKKKKKDRTLPQLNACYSNLYKLLRNSLSKKA